MNNYCLFIITSFDEKFNDGAERIRFESESLGISCKIIIFSKTNNPLSACDISDKDFVYFLTNKISVIKRCLSFLLSKNCFIVNKKFIQNVESKLGVQNIIKKIGVPVPKNLSIEQIRRDRFLKEKTVYPAFIKNKQHCMPMTKIRNKSALYSFCDNLKRKNEWYIEECVGDQGCDLKKIYFTFGKITPRNVFQKKHIEIEKILRNISTALKLDAFSADFIFEKSLSFFSIEGKLIIKYSFRLE